METINEETLKKMEKLENKRNPSTISDSVTRAFERGEYSVGDTAAVGAMEA